MSVKCTLSKTLINTRYVGNLDKRVTDVMMTNILRTGLPHIADNILSAKMFAPSDPVRVLFVFILVFSWN